MRTGFYNLTCVTSFFSGMDVDFDAQAQAQAQGGEMLELRRKSPNLR